MKINKSIFCVLLVFIIFLSVNFLSLNLRVNGIKNAYAVSENERPSFSKEFLHHDQENYNNLNRVNAKGVVVLEQSTNRILHCQNLNDKLPMASTTKIATCITVIENCSDLEKEITIDDRAVGIEGSSIYLEKGEKHKIIDLLYGLMLQSGNDCAVALAYHVGGNIENFCAMMNDLALKAGARNTNFSNPHGLPNDNHYTTAYDLALIASYAMQNDLFRQIVSSTKREIPWGDRDYNRIILNKNKILSTFDGGCGIKTGYTKKAGRCLVSAAQREGMTLICVVLNCPNMFEDSKHLLDQAFDKYSLYPLVDKNQSFITQVDNATISNIELKPEIERQVPLTESEYNGVTVEVKLPTKLTAPIKNKEILGKIDIFIEKRLIFSTNLCTIYEVKSPTLIDRIINFWKKRTGG